MTALKMSNEVEKRYLYVKDCIPWWSEMGVEKWDFAFTNGDEFLLEEGRFYGKDPKVEENERILHIVQITEERVEDVDCRDTMSFFVEKLLYAKYGVYSDNYDWEILDEDGLQEILKNPKLYVRTVGDFQSQMRTKILDNVVHTKSLLRDITDEKVKSYLIGKMSEVVS